MNPALLSPNKDAGIAVGNATIPGEGPKAIPFQLDFSANPQYVLDLLALFQNKSLTSVQTLWVDNTLNAQELTITVEGTSQVLTIPPGDQGYYPVLSPKSGRIFAATNGGVLVKLYLVNVPIQGASWAPGQNNGSYDAQSGALRTEDVNLKPLIDPQKGLLVQQAGGGGGSSTQPAGLIYSGTGMPNWTQNNDANGDLNLYITSVSIFLTPDATIAYQGAGQFYSELRQFKSGGVGPTLFELSYFLPSAAPAAPTTPTGLITLLDWTCGGCPLKVGDNTANNPFGIETDDVKPLNSGNYISRVFGYVK